MNSTRTPFPLVQFTVTPTADGTYYVEPLLFGRFHLPAEIVHDPATTFETISALRNEIVRKVDLICMFPDEPLEDTETVRMQSDWRHRMHTYVRVNKPCMEDVLEVRLIGSSTRHTINALERALGEYSSKKQRSPT